MCCVTKKELFVGFPSRRNLCSIINTTTYVASISSKLSPLYPCKNQAFVSGFRPSPTYHREQILLPNVPISKFEQSPTFLCNMLSTDDTLNCNRKTTYTVYHNYLTALSAFPMLLRIYIICMYKHLGFVCVCFFSLVDFLLFTFYRTKNMPSFGRHRWGVPGSTQLLDASAHTAEGGEMVENRAF